MRAPCRHCGCGEDMEPDAHPNALFMYDCNARGESIKGDALIMLEATHSSASANMTILGPLKQPAAPVLTEAVVPKQRRP